MVSDARLADGRPFGPMQASPEQEVTMSTIVKVIEVIGQSNKGFSEAVATAVAEVAKTVSDIKSVWVDNFTCMVEGQKITHYRANVKVSFLVEGHR